MSYIRHARMLVLALVALLALAACGGDDEPEAGDTPSPAGEQPESGESGESGEAGEAELSAEDLRLTLEQQLGGHASLAIEAMRNGVTGAEEFEPSAAALERNTQDLTNSIELVYGAEGADAFQELWSNHIGFFVQYTQGLAAGDQAMQDEALAQLDQYRQDFSGFLESASEGNIQAGPVAEGLQVHVDQLVGQIDAYHQQDFATAYSTEREAYAHMFATAQSLAGGIAAQFPDRFPSAGGDQVGFGGHDATVRTVQAEGEQVPAIDLQSLLGQQLGEHAMLAQSAMRKGFSGAADFEQAAAALSENTQDLTSSIELVYGPEGAQAFQEMWENHIGFFVDYTVALAEGNDQQREEALAQLEQYRQDFSSFIEEASEGNIPGDAVAAALQVHVDQLVGQIDAYAQGDFANAYTQTYEGYNHMFETAEALAGGIAQQFPERFPGGAPAADGTSHTDEGAHS